MITTKRVKLHSKFRLPGDSWVSRSCKIVPWLNVNGVWLERAGFHAGDQVEIEVSNNQLIIKNLTHHGATSA